MALPKNFKITLDKVPEISKAIENLATTRVMIGVPGDNADRNSDEDSGTINNAALMKIHEDGAPEANIPARPVVHPTIRANSDQIAASMKKAGMFALDGNDEGVDRQMNSTGIMMQNAMRRKITTGPFAPLSERTLAARRAKGHKSVKPLIDTGQLRRALTYVIRKIAWAGKQIKGK